MLGVTVVFVACVVLVVTVVLLVTVVFEDGVTVVFAAELVVVITGVAGGVGDVTAVRLFSEKLTVNA